MECLLNSVFHRPVQPVLGQNAASDGPVQPVSGQSDETMKRTTKEQNGINSYEERLLEIHVEEEKLQVMKRGLHAFQCFVFN